MNKTLLKSKLHRINVTQVELDYEGSCAVDRDFLKLAGMQEYEKVDVYNVTNGERFSTYLILAEAGSKTLSINGAAAHKVSIDDVKKKIADVGHDNLSYKATDEVYDNLHGCCKYRDNPE